MTDLRVGIDGLALREGGGVTWLRRLAPALAAVWPEARVEVLARPEVVPPPDERARAAWSARDVPNGMWRLPVERRVVARWVREARLRVVLVGADAGPARLPCPFVQASLNAKPYAANGLRYSLLRRAARATARGAAATVFLSEAHRRLGEPVLRPARALAIPAGVDLPPDVEPPRPLPSPYVLVVATGYDHKDLPTALSAVLAARRAGRPHRLVWVGAAPDPQVVAALRRAAAADPEALREAGRVDAAALEAWYAHADAVLLPSRLESGGLPVAEALARGVPVVASDIPAIAETADGAARLHAPGDAARAAELLLEVLEAPTVSSGARRAAGRVWAASRTWEAAATRYRRVLEEALRPGG